MNRIEEIQGKFFDRASGWVPIDFPTLFSLSDIDVSHLVKRLIFNGHIVFDNLSETEKIQIFEKWASNPCDETRSYIASIIINLSRGCFSWADRILESLCIGISNPMLLDSIREYQRIHRRAAEGKGSRTESGNSN
jgi:hypothetical protein